MRHEFAVVACPAVIPTRYDVLTRFRWPRVLIIKHLNAGTVIVYSYPDESTSGGDDWYCDVDDAKKSVAEEFFVAKDAWMDVPSDVSDLLDVIRFAFSEAERLQQTQSKAAPQPGPLE